MNMVMNVGYAGGGGIELVGYVTGTAEDGPITLDLTALTGGSGSAAAQNDYVIVLSFFSTQADRTGSTSTSGFNTISTELLGNDILDANAHLYAKFMTATPDTSVTVDWTAYSNSGHVAIAYVLRGVNQSTPLDTTITTVEGSNTAVFDPPAITPVTKGAWILIAGGGAHADGAANDFTQPAFSGVVSESINATTNDATAIIGYYDTWTSGAYNPSAVSWAGSDSPGYAYAGYTIALRPA